MTSVWQTFASFGPLAHAQPATLRGTLLNAAVICSIPSYQLLPHFAPRAFRPHSSVHHRLAAQLVRLKSVRRIYLRGGCTCEKRTGCELSHSVLLTHCTHFRFTSSPPSWE
ncbi:hypothetical protein TRVL_07305 [Trypanosoma vivax]|nr:hypothetical protein TRVL_07305 [Trypanosoma vivax]